MLVYSKRHPSHIMAALGGRLDGPMLDLINATSGSIGAFISTSIVFPLDKFKARLQVGESLTDLLSEVTSDGISKLWDGAQSRVLESTCSKFTYFYFYSLLKSFMEVRNRGQKLGTVVNLIVGYFAAVANNLLTLPLQVTAVRVMVSSKTTTFGKEWRNIVDEEGVFGLWRGIAPSMILCINPAISFASFDQVKVRVLRSRGLDLNSALSAFEAFLIGAICKAVATLVTFPFIRVKTLMQVGTGGQNQKSKQQGERKNATKQDYSEKKVADVLSEIFNQEGFPGLYTGLTPQLIKGVAASAILFAAKEKIFEFTKGAVLYAYAR